MQPALNNTRYMPRPYAFALWDAEVGARQRRVNFKSRPFGQHSQIFLARLRQGRRHGGLLPTRLNIFLCVAGGDPCKSASSFLSEAYLIFRDLGRAQDMHFYAAETLEFLGVLLGAYDIAVMIGHHGLDMHSAHGIGGLAGIHRIGPAHGQ